jgi:hypothetical protein
MIRGKNEDLIKLREVAFNNIEGPRLGDYVIMPNYGYERICNDLDDRVQTTDGRFGSSFHMFEDGCCSFSGGLNQPIGKDDFELTDQGKEGSFWFFSEGIVGAGRGHHFNLMCRVYKHRDIL